MGRSRASRNDMRKTDDGMMPRVNKTVGGVVPSAPDEMPQEAPVVQVEPSRSRDHKQAPVHMNWRG